MGKIEPGDGADPCWHLLANLMLMNIPAVISSVIDNIPALYTSVRTISTTRLNDRRPGARLDPVI